MDGDIVVVQILPKSNLILEIMMMILIMLIIKVNGDPEPVDWLIWKTERRMRVSVGVGERM